MKKTALAICILLNAAISRGQANVASALNEPSSKQWFLRFNALALADPYDQAISLGVEYLFEPRWAAGLDAGYIFRSEYLYESTAENGILLRPFARHYFTEQRIGFVEGNLHYKYASYRVSDWVSKDEVDGVPAYESFDDFQYTKQVIGFDLKIGGSFPFSDESRLNIELYGGLGLRWKTQGTEVGSYNRNIRSFFSIYDPSYRYVSLPAGARLRWRLSK